MKIARDYLKEWEEKDSVELPCGTSVYAGEGKKNLHIRTKDGTDIELTWETEIFLLMLGLASPLMRTEFEFDKLVASKDYDES